MGLLDRLPGEGSRGVLVALVTGVVALLASGLLAWHTWGGEDTDAPTAGATRPSAAAPSLVPVISRQGGFVLTVPAGLEGEQVGDRSVRLRPTRGDLVVTVGPGVRGSLPRAHAAAVDGIRGAYPEVRVERQVDTRMGGGPALRSVGTVRHESGQQLVFSVTTTARGQRTWSAVMFAQRDLKPRRLKRWYQPVLDGFQPLG